MSPSPRLLAGRFPATEEPRDSSRSHSAPDPPDRTSHSASDEPFFELALAEGKRRSGRSRVAGALSERAWKDCPAKIGESGCGVALLSTTAPFATGGGGMRLRAYSRSR